MSLARLSQSKPEIKSQIKFLLNNLGMANQRSADYPKALEYHLESLKLREEANDSVAISVTLNNIGVLFKDMGDYENAHVYFKRNWRQQEEVVLIGFNKTKHC